MSLRRFAGVAVLSIFASLCLALPSNAQVPDPVMAAQAPMPGSDHHYIGTEHLLLALLQESRGNAVKVLEYLDISPEQVRALVLDVLQKAIKH